MWELGKKPKQNTANKESKKKKPSGSIIVVTDHKEKIEDTGKKQFASFFFSIIYVCTLVIEVGNEMDKISTKNDAHVKIRTPKNIGITYFSNTCTLL